jgi:hypothetical protein
MKLGRPATIFVPSVASPAKIDRIRRYGAELVIAGDRYAEALEASQEWTARTGALPIHAYEGVETLLGQGTLGLELEEQTPELDSLLIAVGGGGSAGLRPGTRPERRFSPLSRRRRFSGRSRPATRLMHPPVVLPPTHLRRGKSVG